jgi:hypothetical protein
MSEAGDAIKCRVFPGGKYGQYGVPSAIGAIVRSSAQDALAIRRQNLKRPRQHVITLSTFPRTPPPDYCRTLAATNAGRCEICHTLVLATNDSYPDSKACWRARAAVGARAQ